LCLNGVGAVAGGHDRAAAVDLHLSAGATAATVTANADACRQPGGDSGRARVAAIAAAAADRLREDRLSIVSQRGERGGAAGAHADESTGSATSAVAADGKVEGDDGRRRGSRAESPGTAAAADRLREDADGTGAHRNDFAVERSIDAPAGAADSARPAQRDGNRPHGNGAAARPAAAADRLRHDCVRGGALGEDISVAADFDLSAGTAGPAGAP